MAEPMACCYCDATEGIAQDGYGVWGCTDANAERCRRRCAELDAEERDAALAEAERRIAALTRPPGAVATRGGRGR